MIGRKRGVIGGVRGGERALNERERAGVLTKRGGKNARARALTGSHAALTSSLSTRYRHSSRVRQRSTTRPYPHPLPTRTLQRVVEVLVE